MYTLVIYGKIIGKKIKRIKDICRNNNRLMQNVNIAKCCDVYMSTRYHNMKTIIIFIIIIIGYVKGRLWISLTCLTSEHFRVCNKPGPVFPTFYVVVFSFDIQWNLRWKKWKKYKKYRTVGTVPIFFFRNCSFCWYWQNDWLLPFKTSFYKNRIIKKVSESWTFVRQHIYRNRWEDYKDRIIFFTIRYLMNLFHTVT